MRANRKKCGAKCGECPLSGRDMVNGGTLNDRPKVVIVGDYPDKHSVGEGKPFGGWAGRMLRSGLKEEGKIPEDMYLTYAIACDAKGFGKYEVEEARKCCLPGLIKEIKDVGSVGIIVSMGFYSKRSLGIDEDIKKIRGYTRDKRVGKKDVPVMATFSPEYLVKGNISEVDIWRDDIEKFCRIGYKGKAKFDPDVRIVEGKDAVEAMKEIKNGTIVAVDIETTSLDPDEGEIKCVGFAVSDKGAVVVPLRREGKKIYSESNEKRIWKGIERIVTKCKCIYHNGYFDAFWFEWKGIKGAKDAIFMDTMVLHHAINSETYHSLAFVTSIYADVPYWKDQKFDSDDEEDKDSSKINDESLFRYNGLDCIATFIIWERMQKDAKTLKVLDLAFESMGLLPLLIEMRLNGLPTKKELISGMKRQLHKENKGYDKVLKEIGNLPEFFTFSHANWVRGVVFGEWNTDYWKNARKNYMERIKKGLSTDTKVHKELEQRFRVLTECKTLRLPSSFKPRETEKGNTSLDKLAMDQIIRACVERVEEIDAMKRDGAKKQDEKEGLKETIKFADSYRKIVHNQHTEANFLNNKIWADGRIRGQLKITGTSSGRLSSKKPNLQNLSKEVKVIYESDGWLIEEDFKNIEVYVAGYISGCENLIRAHKEGTNIHTMNTKLWGIDEGHPKWEVYRRCAKSYIFGRIYLGWPKRIYWDLKEAEPDLPITWVEFEYLDRMFQRDNPEIFEWQEREKQKCMDTRMSVNAFGRVRLLHGNDEKKVGREGVNHQIQSLAFDIAKRGMIKFYKEKKEGWDPLVNVHDSLVSEVMEESEIKPCMYKMRECLEMPHNIFGEMVSFPTECKIGKNYGRLKEVHY